MKFWNKMWMITQRCSKRRGAAYDALGRPVTRNADAFAYNDRSEVTSATISGQTAPYGYDPIGNSTNWIANCLNQYAHLSYDPDGNLLTNSVFSYTYNASSRLASVSSNGVLLASFAYDAQGRRVRKVSHRGTETRSHTYFYDGWTPVRETATDLSTLQPFNSSTEYVWGKDLSGSIRGAGGVGGLLYVSISNSSTHQLYIPLYDANGNITHYCDASGNVVASYTYDAFGNTTAQSGAMADTFQHRFSTKYFDSETSLYYYGYRFYSPELMRWINRDPIEEQGGANLYAFCGNNGISKFDANGKSDDQIDYVSLVEWDYEVQYETFVYRPISIPLPIPIRMPVYAAVSQVLPGKAPYLRKRLPKHECPYFKARKLTVYAIPRGGFSSKGKNAVYDGDGQLRYEPIIAIVPSGSTPEGHWEPTWSDVRVMWRYEGRYAGSPFIKKHADYFFYGQQSGKWDVHRAVKINNEARDIVLLESLTFELTSQYIGDAPRR